MWEQKIIGAWLLSCQILLKNFVPEREWGSIRRDKKTGSNKKLAFHLHSCTHSRCHGRGKKEKEIPVLARPPRKGPAAAEGSRAYCRFL